MRNPSNLIGARLGAYEVQSVLGSGGMATVYRGFDQNLNRAVAIKVLSTTAAAQPGFADRFRQEARLIARLRHPNIVQVYDFGVQDELVYMVQELLPGPTLAARLQEYAARNQPMPRREIVMVLRQLAAALDAAHDAGIIHRDVKPSNALYNADGGLVLTDFGIAKSTLGDGTRTQTGELLGTPIYLSPEQARGEPLTPASDIYTLGVVLYELISGRPPFDGPTPLGIVFKHLQEAPPPLQPLRASLPPAVEAVVQRALAKEPGQRYPTADALVRALEYAWPGPKGLPPVADIHSLPTARWQPPGQPAPAAPAPVSAVQPAQLSARSPAAPPRRAPAPARRARTLPVLALALAAVLVVGVLLALRSERPPPSAGAAATAQPAPDAPAAATASSAPAAPDGEPAAGPLQELRAILGDGAGAAVQATLDDAERALASGDSGGAAQTLGALQGQILQARREGTISPETMRASLRAVQDAADREGLRLPLQTGS